MIIRLTFSAFRKLSIHSSFKFRGRERYIEDLNRLDRINYRSQAMHADATLLPGTYQLTSTFCRGAQKLKRISQKMFPQKNANKRIFRKFLKIIL
mgnify:CR=1 FL=1